MSLSVGRQVGPFQFEKVPQNPNPKVNNTSAFPACAAAASDDSVEGSSWRVDDLLERMLGRRMVVDSLPEPEMIDAD